MAGFDFPFSLPKELLDSASFARAVGRPAPFRTWQAFNAFVAEELPLTPPADYARFAGWRQKTYWRPRATDRDAIPGEVSSGSGMMTAAARHRSEAPIYS